MTLHLIIVAAFCYPNIYYQILEHIRVIDFKEKLDKQSHGTLVNSKVLPYIT